MMTIEDAARLAKMRLLYEQLIAVMKKKNNELLPSGEKILFESSIDYIENSEYALTVKEITSEFIPVENYYQSIRPYRGLAEIASYLAERDPEITSLVEQIGRLATEGTLAHMQKYTSP